MISRLLRLEILILEEISVDRLMRTGCHPYTSTKLHGDENDQLYQMNVE